MADFYMLNQRFLDEIKAIDIQDPEYGEKVKALNAKYENLKSNPAPTEPPTEPVKYDPFTDIDKTINETMEEVFGQFKSFQDRSVATDEKSGYMKYESSVCYIDASGQRQETRVSKSRKMIDGKDVEVKETTKRYEDDERIITETIDRNGKRSVTTRNKRPVYEQYLVINPPRLRTAMWRNLMFPALFW
jgi:hypothetical protein